MAPMMGPTDVNGRTADERLLRAVRFERPDRIPVSMGINKACWHHYPQAALQDLIDRKSVV